VLKIGVNIFSNLFAVKAIKFKEDEMGRACGMNGGD
jgi:hypothetical protein